MLRSPSCGVLLVTLTCHCALSHTRSAVRSAAAGPQPSRKKEVPVEAKENARVRQREGGRQKERSE
ncbi:hypothetical protein NQZ68_005738 [Dissostichus eleginoides]|nr:hypothetical protein NQZ68_005738 [Dissostichus eleginoides]